MRKLLRLTCTFLLFFCCGSQETKWQGTIAEVDGVVHVSNPNRPIKADAGRVVRLEEIIRIRDDGKQAVFRAPFGLEIGADGSFYCYDYWQLYRFDDAGGFVFKIIDQGQGPGEASGASSFLVTDDEIIVQAASPPKVMRFDRQGNHRGETTTEQTRPLTIVGTLNGRVYSFLQDYVPDEMGKEGFVDFPTILYESDMDFSRLDAMAHFPVRHYVRKGGWWPRARLDYALMDDQSLFVSHQGEYRIVKYSLAQNRVEMSFDRDYARIKFPTPEKREQPSGTAEPPPRDHDYDIAKLLSHRDSLWVITSTKDAQDRFLVDVYTEDGRYVDNFYLGFPDGIHPRHFAYGSVISMGDHIYTIDEHDDGFFSLAKYRITGLD